METTVDQIAEVFREFDVTGSGFVTIRSLLHLLGEVQTTSQLSDEEIAELIKHMAIPELEHMDLDDEIDYEKFIRRLVF